MSRQYDIVVFGGTGFTGERVARYIHQTQKAEEKQARPLKWAIAGRNEAGLIAVRQRLDPVDPDSKDSDAAGNAASAVPLILADVSNDASLNEMCKQATVIINCVGPFRFFGEQVVRACVTQGTHYVDITGEPEFIERMMVKYHQQAVEQRVLIVPCCGFDSIPADCGATYAQQQFKQAYPNGVVNGLEVFFYVSGDKGFKGHYATWASAVHGISSADDLRGLRRQLRARQTADGESKVPRPPGPPLRIKAGMPFFEQRVQRYCTPFMGADASVVANTQHLHLERSKQGLEAAPLEPQPYYAEYLAVGKWYNMLGLALIGFLLKVLSSCGCGKRFLLNHPKFCTFGTFSHEGPSEEQMKATSFEMVFFARGYDSAEAAAANKPMVQVASRVAGPEPGYVATPICVVEAAKTILFDLSKNGALTVAPGVVTPSVAFMDPASHLVERVTARGVRFERQPNA